MTLRPYLPASRATVRAVPRTGRPPAAMSAARLSAAAAIVRDEPGISGAELARRVGVGPTRGARLLAEVRATVPDLEAPPPTRDIDAGREIDRQNVAEVNRLAAELATARAVPADVEALVKEAVDGALEAGRCAALGHAYLLTRDPAYTVPRLNAAIARAIATAATPPLTVGGLLSTAPVVEYQVDLGRGPRWRQTRHGRTRTWLGMSWTEWSVGSDDVDEYAARLVPAAEADADPNQRGPLPAAK